MSDRSHELAAPIPVSATTTRRSILQRRNQQEIAVDPSPRDTFRAFDPAAF